MKNKKSTSQRKSIKKQQTKKVTKKQPIKKVTKKQSIKKVTKKQPTKKQVYKKQVSKKQPPKKQTKKNEKIKLAIRVVEYEKKVFKKYINNKKIRKTIKKQAPAKNLSKRKIRIVKGYSIRGQKFTSKFYKVNSIKEYDKIFNSLKKNKKSGSNLTIITFEYTGKIDLNNGKVTGQKCVTRKLIKKRKNKKDKLNDSVVTNFLEVAQNLYFLNEQYELELLDLEYLIEQ